MCRDHQHDPNLDPPLPRTIHQGRDAFLRTADKAYMLALQRKAGTPTPGRPRLAAAESR